MIHALACPAAAPRPTAAVERAARAALRTATGNGNRERAGALNPLSWAAGASAAGRLPCLASPFFGGDSKAACRRLASQLAAHSATMGRSAISHGELAALLVDGEASMPSAWLAVRSVRATAKRPQFDKAPVTVVCRCLHGTPPAGHPVWRGSWHEHQPKSQAQQARARGAPAEAQERCEKAA